MKLEDMKRDATLQDTLEELYAGDGRTYADELAAVEDWAGAYTVLVRACSIARMSGDYCAVENIREAVGAYHAELTAGRTAALYAAQLAQWAAHATR